MHKIGNFSEFLSGKIGNFSATSILNLYRAREVDLYRCTAREKKRMHKRPIYVEIL